MPNWTANTIRAKGTERDLRTFLESVKWQDQLFDFNRIIPMPEILKHTGCGGRTINGEKVGSWYVIDPNDQLHGDRNVRRFTEDEEAILKEIGHRNWYSWSNENWGTKWNACSAQVSDKKISKGYVEISFDTAWAHPMPVFHKMFEMFPKLSFVCTWQYEGEYGRHAIESAATAGGLKP